MYALVLAGGIPTAEDPLYPQTQDTPKALLDVAGRPMAQWVLDALSHAKAVQEVVLTGEQALKALPCDKPVHLLPDSGSMLENILAGLQYIHELDPSATHGLVLSSDIPGITSEMIDWRIEAGQQMDFDLQYLVVTREVMETRYPTSGRSYLRLKDVEVCGGDATLVRLAISSDDGIWPRIVAARKSPLRQAGLIGFDTLLLVLTRRLSLQQAEKQVSKRLGLMGQVQLSPYAELAMDVDKPHQLEIMRQDLSQGGDKNP